MKVTFDKNQLLAALLPASGISQVKNTLMTVEGLLFECPPREKYGKFSGDITTTCRISAFDLDKGLQTTVPCRIQEEGIYCIQTSKILQIIRVMPEGEVMLEIDDRNRVKVTGGQSSFEITAQNGMDFPTMPMFIGERVYQIPQYIIRDIINETAFAVGQNDPRPAFNGALFRIRDGLLTVVGCDGDRLAAANTMLPPGSPDAEMIIPGRFLLELSKMLADTEEELTMIIGRKHIIFHIGEIWFFTRMIDAEYMKYEKFLPTAFRLQCYVSAAELTGAIERATLITEDKLGGNSRPFVKLSFENATQSIAISSVSSGGSVFERVPCAMDGEDISIGFNCRLLVGAFRALPEDAATLRLRLNTPYMGMVIEPAGGTGFVHAAPDPEVYGTRSLDQQPQGPLINQPPQDQPQDQPQGQQPPQGQPQGQPHTAPAEEEKSREYMYFVMPIRMNK